VKTLACSDLLNRESYEIKRRFSAVLSLSFSIFGEDGRPLALVRSRLKPGGGIEITDSHGRETILRITTMGDPVSTP